MFHVKHAEPPACLAQSAGGGDILRQRNEN